MEPIRLLHLRGMPQIGELHQRRAGNQPGGLLAQYLVVAQLGLDRRRRDIAADGGGVRGADQQQGGYRQVLELVIDRLGTVVCSVGIYLTPV